MLFSDTQGEYDHCNDCLIPEHVLLENEDVFAFICLVYVCKKWLPEIIHFFHIRYRVVVLLAFIFDEDT